MASGVPDLKANGSGGLGIEDPFGQEGGADGAGRGWGRESVLDVALNEGSFPDTCGAEDADFGLQGTRHYLLFKENGESKRR